MPVKCSLRQGKKAVVEEAEDMWDNIRNQRCTVGFAFAVLCVFIVIVGNIILIIGLNFWITVFPRNNLEHNSSQIAIQVVASLLMVLFFSAVTMTFVAVYGGVPIWRTLTDTNRMEHPAYRFFLLFASGATNGLSGVTGVYSISNTPEFIQTVLLCSIPFCAQAWTVIFIPEERKRNYLSLFFIACFVLFVAGILLSSMTAFLHHSETATKASWEWALMYLLSCVLFGLWCVVQRLYLDAMIVRDGCERDESDADPLTGEEGSGGTGAAKGHKKKKAGGLRGLWRQARARRADQRREQQPEGEEAAVVEMRSVATAPHVPREAREAADEQSDTRGSGDGKLPTQQTGAAALVVAVAPAEAEGDATGTRRRARQLHNQPFSDLDDGQPVSDAGANDDEENNNTDEEEDADIASARDVLLAEKRAWARQSVNDNAAKLVLLLVGLFFQLLVSFVAFPVDAIPWFGTSSTVSEAWSGFASSVNFIFHSWHNIRHGLLYTLGYIMSFIGCTFLNEHSPTLASVVLQLAGPITSLVIIIVPQWNAHQDSGNVGHKVGGVVLLFVAAFLYHVWEQRSLREMLRRAHETEQLAVEEGEEREAEDGRDRRERRAEDDTGRGGTDRKQDAVANAVAGTPRSGRE